METENTSKVIALKDLWDIFVRRLLIIALVAVMVMMAAFIVKTITYKPRYSSTATMYILRQRGDEASSGEAASDFSVALAVVKDCNYLLKSEKVVSQVISSLKLDEEYKDLSECISTHNPTSTRILEVTVEADTPAEAKRIVDELCIVGAESINSAMGFEQVGLFQNGTLEKMPCNRTSLTFYLFLGVIAAVVTYGIFLLIFLLDDKIRNDEDVERYLGLTVLGDIPDAYAKRGKRYGGYGYRMNDEDNEEHIRGEEA